MKTTRSWARFLLAAAATLALAAGCGGGVGTGGTGSFAQGPITGFGSVIVNGVRFDDGAAQVVDADGNARSRDDLRLGMMVDIDAGPIDSSGSGSVASADRIRYASEMVGPLVSVDRTAGLLTLLGQTVQVETTTVFDDRLAGGIGALFAGRQVEIYAAYDVATGRYRASRIEPSSSTDDYRLRGVVGQLDSAARALSIGGARFDWGGAAAVPPTLANGDFVRLRLQPAPAGSSSWTVLSFAGSAAQPEDGRDAEVNGLVSAFSSAAAFSVNGQPVNADGANFPDGTGTLGPGARVAIEGRLQGGVLLATKVSIESDQQQSQRRFELHGSIGVVDPVAQTFMLRGVTVGYGRSDIEIGDGTLADIATGRHVEVKGVLSSDGTQLDATEIEFGD